MHVIGTAGHVDHGKSTLVRALTGIDPDRLAEEQQRGMTIDLGFAWVTLPSGREASIVDVPGHERFIKNMLAGVGGIDLALLVVAADESVMPPRNASSSASRCLASKRLPGSSPTWRPSSTPLACWSIAPPICAIKVRAAPSSARWRSCSRRRLATARHKRPCRSTAAPVTPPSSRSSATTATPHHRDLRRRDRHPTPGHLAATLPVERRSGLGRHRVPPERRSPEAA